jgi:hypothetical protein
MTVLYHQLLGTLFGYDGDFPDIRRRGPSERTVAAVRDFWADPAFGPLLDLLPLQIANWNDLQALLARLVVPTTERGQYQVWLRAAEQSGTLVATDPAAAVLVALQANTAWVGALGDNLYHQPWTGHHPGWHVFPLALGRNLAKADAIWTARLVTEHAVEFIETAKAAQFEPRLQQVLSQYGQVESEIARHLEDAVQALAWDVHAACDLAEPNFRPEIAGLLWTLGRVPQANLMRGAQSAYVPPRPLLAEIVGESIRRMRRDPLQQYFWLAMKDRGPFDLRSHRTLFGMINARFEDTRMHFMSALLPDDPFRVFAKAATGYFSGREIGPERDLLATVSDTVGSLLSEEDPSVYVRINAMLNLIMPIPQARRVQYWLELARVSTAALRTARRLAVFEPFDQTLDIPFFYLDEAFPSDRLAALDAIEQYRAANLSYWFALVPTPAPDAAGKAAQMLERERELIHTLRGGWFVGLLPHLPMHYRRYGFSLSEGAPHTFGEAVAGAAGDRGNPARTRDSDPFDVGLARDELRDTWKALNELYTEMAAEIPEYAERRRQPTCDCKDFAKALSSHRR